MAPTTLERKRHERLSANLCRGAWLDPQGADTIEVISPVTERPIGRITSATAGDVDRAVEAARRAFRSFSRTTRQERIDLLGSVLAAYAKRRQDLADALVEELGAPAMFAKEWQAGMGLLHVQTAMEALRPTSSSTPKVDGR
jgi:aldehyde dehydrogenase (NAD+)